MELYERIVGEASKEGKSPVTGRSDFGSGKRRSPLAPGAGGYLTVEDLEWEEERRERERMKILREEKRRASEIRALRIFARQGVHSPFEGMAFRSLRRKYPGDWDLLKKW